MCVRFDDSLSTVLAADTTSAFGARSAFRQLVDLIGRRRVEAAGEPMARLRRLRDQVPPAVRAASARALALADPPAELVTFFAEDETAIAAPVLRSARLADADWLALLPRIGPAGRAVLRARDAMSAAVVRALDAFGTTDFTLAHHGSAVDESLATETVALPRPQPETMTARAAGQTFAIAELVQRIDEFQRVRDDRTATRPARVDRFAFETDPAGVICWVDGASRAGLVGRALGEHRGGSQTLSVGGVGDAAGDWILSRVAVHAPDTGRRLGDRGLARRVVNDTGRAVDPDALRRLVHELRTPTNAIAGFAELIESGLLGPVAPVHRDRAGAIGREVGALLTAIEDLEVSARVDGGALDLRPSAIAVVPALAAAIAAAGAEDRIVVAAEPDLGVTADERALERLFARLTGTLAQATPQGMVRTIHAQARSGEVVMIWPWTTQGGDSSVLGADFTLRLAHKLARALGGRLESRPDRLTLHLPAAFNAKVQAATH